MLRFLCLIAVVSMSVLAQTPDTATLRGRVVDPSQAVIAHAQITVTNSLTGAKRSTESEASGDFSLAGLGAGAYDIVASKQGFADQRAASVTLEGGTTAELT